MDVDYLRAPINESVEARIREISDALQLLRNLVAKRFEELKVYERLSVRQLHWGRGKLKSFNEYIFGRCP